ncbi:MAG TPA: GGDEF domain-containing protein [Thiobacillus sp.]|nr:MAG: GGDEF domain-containing protein [Hydrogenophilales bacterium 16-64-40]OZA34425.1 MAG: GGDEF domain-containing protein [Hydrogenophilales bacterium 17-64-65]HQS81703.1 GGDEF domain-containing protein [Thiobacillus sp.]
MSHEEMRVHLQDILANARLITLLQPVLDLVEGRVMAYEALTRGPSNSPLHAPQALFRVAEQHGLMTALDWACVRMAFKTFAQLNLQGRLFVNLSPGSLLDASFAPDAVLAALGDAGMASNQVVIEITENATALDYGDLRQAVSRLRAAGIEVAIDDLGEGFSSLRLWSELKPAFVKIDKHFIADIHQDPHKIQFVRSIRQLAEGAHSCVIAEGVESPSELAVLKDLGIRYAQGYLIGRPSPVPIRLPSREVQACLQSGTVSVFPMLRARDSLHMSAGKLVASAPSVTPLTASQKVLELMMQHPDLHAVAVVDKGIPVGIIHRPALLDRFISLYGRELHGRKPCRELMDADPLIVDKATRMTELSELVVKKGKAAFTQGFIITSEGRYLGLGSGFDLMREVTEMQIVAARYANPLTGLPGNVPVQEHLERLLVNEQTFVTAYFDLDHFKPYNDVYGFRRGDVIIQLLARILHDSCNAELDFAGHIGGDDFVVLFQSLDWEVRCHGMLTRFDRECLALFNSEHVEAGGYHSEDRRGVMAFHALVSLSIGAVLVDPAHFHQYQEVARAASQAKHMAKRIDGSSLFIDQRRMPFGRQLVTEESFIGRETPARDSHPLPSHAI